MIEIYNRSAIAGFNSLVKVGHTHYCLHNCYQDVWNTNTVIPAYF